MSTGVHHIVSVTQLNEYVQGLLKRDPLLRSIRVQGELSGFKRHSSGHAYFSLKDAGAVVRCVMFRSAAQTLQFQPKDGMQVLLLAEVSLYARDGQYQLYVQAMQPHGEGELYRRFLLLKTKLESSGYFDNERKRPLPYLPACVGIITSDTGAALQDMLQIIRRRYPMMDMEVCPVLVQGESAAAVIAKAIRFMSRQSHASVLIVGRGGGSLEDLWAFNDERVAQAIFESKLPVISAVGHETDFTIADFVADVRAPTPSAAAELCVPEYAALAQRLDALTQRLPGILSRALNIKKQRIYLLLQTRGFSATEHAIDRKCQQVQALQSILTENLTNALRAKRITIENLLLRLHTLSPTHMLARGFAVISGTDGRVIVSAVQLKNKMPVKLTMYDGTADAIITGVLKNNHEG